MLQDVFEIFSLKDQERRQNYRTCLDFYRGRQWPGAEKWGEKRLTFNYARVFIDKMTSYLLNGRRPVVEAREDNPAEREEARAAERALAEVYAENYLEQLDYETETDCAVLGDGCYKVTWEEDGTAGRGRVRVTAPDVQGIQAWWVGDDIARVWKVASRYALSAEEAERLHNIQIVAKGGQLTEIWTEAEFELYLDNRRIEKKANPYGFIPFVIFPNLREPKQFWGTSDLAALIQPQQELNRAMSQISHILELSGNPVAVLENVEESRDIAVRPGAVWNIPEDSRAYLLDLLKDGGLNLHMGYIELLFRSLHDISEMPRAAFGGTQRDLSGVAMQIELYPLLQRVMRKRMIRNAVYNRRSRMILALLNRFKDGNGKAGLFDLQCCCPGTVWGQVLPQDQARLVESEKALVQSGIHSRRRAMDDLGVKDPEAEFGRWLEEEKRMELIKGAPRQGQAGGVNPAK